ncbi:MAG TPA: A/G-specific adenine glycosylase [Thermoanaerobaculia bacterium]|nr:A/G-specific adenine glycosylase [Thermoanaerobaculia bacterium]
MKGEQDSLGPDLIAWFDRHRRDLPWRRSRDPYRIWLSEVMLQQTRVEAALPYYERFVERFPTVDKLARAPLDEVLALWSGLGYYRRARQLHAAACQIAAAREFPSTVDRLLELPGVGAYTAAAVASIAFGATVPVLDGNVERVMARKLALAGDPKLAKARAHLLAAAAALLDPTRPGDSNQALMELGATVCLPQRPRCLLCPLRPGCAAAREGRPESYPPPRRRRAGEIRRLLMAVVIAPAREDDRILLFRQRVLPGDGRGPGPAAGPGFPAGAWELPWLDLESVQMPVHQALSDKYGGQWRLGPPLAEVRHGITYRDLRVTVCRADLVPGEIAEAPEGIDSGWFQAAERATLHLSSLVGKVLKACARE